MPMFQTSYETTVGSMFVTRAIDHAIREAIVRDRIDTVNLSVRSLGETKPVFITGAFSSESDIPLFTHPISVKNFQGNNYLCTDMRFFIRKDTNVQDIESGVKNLTEFNFNKSRAILNLLWLDHGVSQIRNSLPFGGMVFAAWLSETISKTYALDFSDQSTLAVIAHFYYQALFSEETVFDEESKQRMAVHTIKATKMPAAKVFAIFDKITSIKSVDDFCSNVVGILENVRLKDFNRLMLLSIVKNSWFGLNAKEVISVSLEHPPTWLAILFTALNERTFKNSQIYRIAERFGKNGAADEFNKSYINLIKSMTLRISREDANDVLEIPDFEEPTEIATEWLFNKKQTESDKDKINLESTSVHEMLKMYVDYLHGLGGKNAHSFKGVSSSDLHALEQSVNGQLPSSYIEALKFNDGPLPIEIEGHPDSLFHKWKLIPAGKIPALMDAMAEELTEKTEEGKNYGESDYGIREIWWHKDRKWVPIFEADSYLAFIDLDPINGGKKGQIVSAMRYGTHRELLAESFEDFLRQFLYKVF